MLGNYAYLSLPSDAVAERAAATYAAAFAAAPAVPAGAAAAGAGAAVAAAATAVVAPSASAVSAVASAAASVAASAPSAAASVAAFAGPAAPAVPDVLPAAAVAVAFAEPGVLPARSPAVTAERAAASQRGSLEETAGDAEMLRLAGRSFCSWTAAARRIRSACLERALVSSTRVHDAQIKNTCLPLFPRTGRNQPLFRVEPQTAKALTPQIPPQSSKWASTVPRPQVPPSEQLRRAHHRGASRGGLAPEALLLQLPGPADPSPGLSMAYTGLNHTWHPGQT